jgi:hypothetical protein
MSKMDWMVRHAMLVGLIGVAIVVPAGKVLGVDPGVVGLAVMAVIGFVSYLTVEEISRRNQH